MNERIRELIEVASGDDWRGDKLNPVMLVELIVRECVRIIETQRVSVGNSPSGEMAAKWTMDALRECRTEIKEHFGVR